MQDSTPGLVLLPAAAAAAAAVGRADLIVAFNAVRKPDATSNKQQQPFPINAVSKSDGTKPGSLYRRQLRSITSLGIDCRK